MNKLKTRTHDWSNFPYETHKILHAKNKYNFLHVLPLPIFCLFTILHFSTTIVDQGLLRHGINLDEKNKGFRQLILYNVNNSFCQNI